MYDLKESGKRIKELRKKRGLTQEQLGEAVGLSYKTVNYIENGVRGTTIDNMDIMAGYFGVSIDYLARGKELDNGLSILLEELSEEKRKLAMRVFRGIIECI